MASLIFQQIPGVENEKKVALEIDQKKLNCFVQVSEKRRKNQIESLKAQYSEKCIWFFKSQKNYQDLILQIKIRKWNFQGQ